jgi:hypothetical protein
MRPALRLGPLSLAAVLCTWALALGCEEDPGRSILSRGSPQPVGDLRTTQRGVHAADANERAALAEPRIDDKEPVDIDRGPVDAGAGNRKPIDRQPFDVGRPPVLDGGSADRRSLDAGPGAR